MNVSPLFCFEWYRFETFGIRADAAIVIVDGVFEVVVIVCVCVWVIAYDCGEATENGPLARKGLFLAVLYC